MQSLKIYLHKPGQEKPEKTITIPITVLHLGLDLLPKRAKALLDKEGIDLSVCRELTKEKGLKGTIIEIESAEERMIIAME